MRGAVIAGAIALGGAAAAQPLSFLYDPKPRWAQDPDIEIVCAAVRAECQGLLKDGQIDAEWQYDAVYDAEGMLVGLRTVKSTGCKPLDEHEVLDHRHFLTVFTKGGEPDLDGIRAELAPGTPRDSVRLVKRDSMSISFGC